MSAAQHLESSEAEIRALMSDWAEAVRVQDLDRIMSAYAQDVVAYDAIGQLRFKGIEAYRQHWRACFDLCPPHMLFEIQDLAITAGHDIAFSHGLVKCGPSEPEGEDKTGSVRLTTCYRKLGGRWLVVHDHFSVPFEVETGKAMCNLKA